MHVFAALPERLQTLALLSSYFEGPWKTIFTKPPKPLHVCASLGHSPAKRKLLLSTIQPALFEVLSLYQ